MSTRVISATEFKAKCLALLDEVEARGDSLTITKRGRPVATVSPTRKRRLKSPEGSLAGKIDLPDDFDIVHFSMDWEVLEEKPKRGRARP